MNSTWTPSSPAFASPTPRFPSRIPAHSKAAGFSLVEVLVTALLIGVGLLGMITLQGRVIAYTTEATQRTTAAMLAGDLLELIRATPSSWALYLQNGAPANSSATSCAATPATPAAQLACWRAEVATLLPGSSDLPASTTYVCRSPAAGVCSAQGEAIEIQVAWTGSQGACPTANAYCHVRLRSEI